MVISPIPVVIPVLILVSLHGDPVVIPVLIPVILG